MKIPVDWMREWLPEADKTDAFFGLDRTGGINRKPTPWWEELKTRLHKAWQALRGSYD
jgi:hypothetical protein